VKKTCQFILTGEEVPQSSRSEKIWLRDRGTCKKREKGRVSIKFAREGGRLDPDQEGRQVNFPMGQEKRVLRRFQEIADMFDVKTQGESLDGPKKGRRPFAFGGNRGS